MTGEVVMNCIHRQETFAYIDSYSYKHVVAMENLDDN